MYTDNEEDTHKKGVVCGQKIGPIVMIVIVITVITMIVTKRIHIYMKGGWSVWGRKVGPGWAAAPTFPSAEHWSQGRAEH